jgi:hypothetical protein
VFYLLASLTLLLTAADHWTTYLCLRAPVDGWAVTEANPLAEWLFGAVGLVPGLMVDSALTVFAVAFLLTTPRLHKNIKGAFFVCVVLSTTYAVINNLEAIRMLGLSPTGGA